MGSKDTEKKIFRSNSSRSFLSTKNGEKLNGKTVSLPSNEETQQERITKII